MTKQDKKTKIEQLADSLRQSRIAVFASFRGIASPEVNLTKKKVKGEKASMELVKNTFLKKALENLGVSTQDKDLWKDEIAMLKSSNGDPIRLAKILSEWLGENQKVRIKAALLPAQKRWLTKEEVLRLSKLAGVKQVQVEFLGVLARPPVALVAVLNSLPLKLLWILQAKCQQEDVARTA